MRSRSHQDKLQREKKKTKLPNRKSPASQMLKAEPKTAVTKRASMTPDTGKISSGISKRITFTVTEELHKKAFLLARRQGTTVKDLLTDFLEKATINEQV